MRSTRRPSWRGQSHSATASAHSTTSSAFFSTIFQCFSPHLPSHAFHFSHTDPAETVPAILTPKSQHARRGILRHGRGGHLAERLSAGVGGSLARRHHPHLHISMPRVSLSFEWVAQTRRRSHLFKASEVHIPGSTYRQPLSLTFVSDTQLRKCPCLCYRCDQFLSCVFNFPNQHLLECLCLFPHPGNAFSFPYNFPWNYISRERA